MDMIRRFVLSAVLLCALAGLVAGFWWRGSAGAVGHQLSAYRIGQAASYSQAAREIAALERSPNADETLRELAAGWGTGNQSFDYYVARRVSDPQASEALRRAFSLELSWRPELLPRWARYWSWRVKQPPAEEIRSIAEYLDALATVAPPRPLTWREVLNLQAAFALTDQTELAKRLTPENWPKRYRGWRTDQAAGHKANRPRSPFPDWKGPAPAL